jgi:hypothetical protein
MFGIPGGHMAIAKLAGLAVGLVYFFALPSLTDQIALNLRWGLLLWYLSLGAVIGLSGLALRQMMPRRRVPGWLIGAGVGLWFNFLAMVLGWQMIGELLAGFALPAELNTPLILLPEGIVLGGLIGAITHLLRPLPRGPF